MHVEAERLQLRHDRGLGRRIAVDDEESARVSRGALRLPLHERAGPVEELRFVRMRGEAADGADLAADLAHLAVDADLLRALLQVRPQRALSLVADEEDRRRRIADEIAQMEEHPSAGEHA